MWVRTSSGVVILSAGVNAGLGFLFMLVGVAIFAFYAQPSGTGMPELATEDQILPHFVATQAAGMGLAGLKELFKRTPTLVVESEARAEPVAK